MALMGWLRAKLSSRDTENDSDNEALVLTSEEENLDGLNLTSALAAHTAWKTRLSNELEGDSAEKLDISLLSQDNQCELGRWLYGEGSLKYSHIPEFNMVCRAHSEFHFCAAEVVIEHQSGAVEHAKSLLKGKFRQASNKNQLELVRFFAVAKKLL
ncbi:CZB domain-containing protein [uncultured Deefgea sp.]|uniref:CZB domain-containing protein n=1 Tax=uncultured Deefgea sp. TaxID=1304914 RepID=UPI0026307871|nr:CZB domain-containing protein [uncultured Deefgea sp.]